MFFLAHWKDSSNCKGFFTFLVLDSSTKFHKNFSYGNTYDFGNFQNCINIFHNSSQTEVVNGQHCMIQFYSAANESVAQGAVSSFYNFGWENLHKKFGGAICLPASCSPQMIRNFVQEIFEGTGLVLSDDYNQSDYCKNGSRRENAAVVWVTTTAVFTTLISIAIIQTVYDITVRIIRSEKPKKKFIIFSCYTNGLNLMSLTQSNDAIKCVDGIKVLSTLAIIGFHSSYHRKFFPLSDSQMFNDWEDTFLSFVTFGCHFFVESFFVISGLLIARSILKELKTWVNFKNELWLHLK